MNAASTGWLSDTPQKSTTFQQLLDVSEREVKGIEDLIFNPVRKAVSDIINHTSSSLLTFFCRRMCCTDRSGLESRVLTSGRIIPLMVLSPGEPRN